MKLNSSEEYGLRCLLQLARQTPGSLTIPEISQAEGITHHNVAKLLRILRQGGFVASARGQQGGYALAKPPPPNRRGRRARHARRSPLRRRLLRSLRRQRGLLHALAHRVFSARAVGDKCSRPSIKFYRAQPSPTCWNRATPSPTKRPCSIYRLRPETDSPPPRPDADRAA